MIIVEFKFLSNTANVAIALANSLYSLKLTGLNGQTEGAGNLKEIGLYLTIYDRERRGVKYVQVV